MKSNQFNSKLKTLKSGLPNWHFEQYGKSESVACFPPGGPNRDNYIALKAFAFIEVYGPIYVVTNLK